MKMIKYKYLQIKLILYKYDYILIVLYINMIYKKIINFIIPILNI